MLERPDAAGLLETARDVLLRELLPHLPESKRFEARVRQIPVYFATVCKRTL